jgi:acyl dehydratase
LPGKYFEDLTVGDSFVTTGRTITETDIVQFLNLIRNLEPQFSDREFYEKEWVFKRLAAPGALTFSIATGLFTHLGLVSGTGLGFVGMDEFRLPKPLFCGDTLHLELSIVEKRLSRSGRGVVSMTFVGKNQNDEVVMQCRQTYLLALRPQ